MSENPGDAITPQQLELIALYASGHQLNDIAEMKFLAYFTVRNKLAEASNRVGAKSLAHLCALAVENGLIVKNGHGYKPVQMERVIGE
jgi:DNA-binding NarL/FixJ family response regulator